MRRTDRHERYAGSDRCRSKGDVEVLLANITTVVMGATLHLELERRTESIILPCRCLPGYGCVDPTFGDILKGFFHQTRKPLLGNRPLLTLVAATQA